MEAKKQNGNLWLNDEDENEEGFENQKGYRTFEDSPRQNIDASNQYQRTRNDEDHLSEDEETNEKN